MYYRGNIIDEHLTQTSTGKYAYNISMLENLNAIRQIDSSEDELRLHIKIFDKSALLSVSDLKGNITYANENFCRASKYSLEELLNQPHSIVRHLDTSPEVFKNMWRTIGQGNVWQGEIKNLAKDGSHYWVNAVIVPVLGKNGKPVKYVSIRFDITQQKEAEELRKIKEKINNELIENVAYAKYIHNSFLGCEEELSETFKDSFLLYQARNVISGDFYRFEKREGKITVVLGDTTGHGVSASYVSILALNILVRVMEFCSGNPVKILRIMNRELTRMTHLSKKILLWNQQT